MEDSLVSFQPDRALDVLDGHLVLAHLGGHHTKQMDRIGMIRLHSEDLPIDLLGDLQPAASMVLDRNRQRFRNRCHSRVATVTLSLRCRSPEGEKGWIPIDLDLGEPGLASLRWRLLAVKPVLCAMKRFPEAI